MSAIAVEKLEKQYGNHKALKGISFVVDEGEVVGFLGPNGAGKSTTLKIVTGFIAPSSGTAKIKGINVLENPIQAQKQIGYLPENAPLYDDMRVKEYLEYISDIRKIGRSERQYAIEKIAKQCGITDRLNQVVGELSKGYRQRVGLAQALLHDPPILILDEPTTGLDPNQIVEIRKLIREIGKTKTVILSTHILSEVRLTCDRVVIIHNGNLVADGKVDDVISHTRGGLRYRVLFGNDTVKITPNILTEALQKIDGITEVLQHPNAGKDIFAYSISSEEDVRADLFRFAVQQGILLLELAPEQGDLEDVFHQLTEGQ
jgi:ABC-2 type transport system ATP-binding protein